MRVMVTGATGFVGSHLVEALCEKKVQVNVFTRKSSNDKWITGLPLNRHYGDMSDPESLRDALDGVETVFHLAGVTKAYDEKTYIKVNAEGTKHLLDACLAMSSPPKRIVIVSSLAAAGPSTKDRPKKESDPCEPVSPYGRSKRMTEEVAAFYTERLSIVIVRPPAVYGPRDGDFLSSFKLIKKGWDVIPGSGDMILSLIHARDLADGIILASEADVPSGEKFFLSDGEIHSWTKVAAAMGKVMGVSVQTIHIPAFVAKTAALFSEFTSRLHGQPPVLNRQRVNEWLYKYWTCDITSAEERIGFEPRISLIEGLEDTYKWYHSQGWL